LRSRRIAVLGFGNQGAAHARLLAAAGYHVHVGARPDGAGARHARDLGFEVLQLADAVVHADLVAVLLPDEVLPDLWPALAPHVASDAALVFAHGFNLLYSDLTFPDTSDVFLVSPTAPGRVLGQTPEQRGRIPAYLAVHHDASGSAWTLGAAYAEALFLGPIVRSTVREETEVDLFGEQAVLCGGMNALVRTAFEVLVAHGYSPEVAYLECVHQLRYLAELLNERGPRGFRDAISGTARYGDLTRGPRVIGPESRRAMEELLEEIRSGAFAREWRGEVEAGAPKLRVLLDEVARHPIETARCRAVETRSGPDDPPSESGNALSKK
jgi:ketol-acid reductoisomerase